MANIVEILLKASDRTGPGFRGALGNVRALTNAVGQYATLAAGAAVASVAALTKNAIDYADEMGKAAQRTGIGVEALSRLRFAASLSDVELDTLQTSVRHLSNNLAEAAGNPASKAAEAFRIIGVNIQEADGRLRATEHVIADVAEAFSTYRDGAEKAALATELFGKSGTALIPLLNAGREGLRRMGEDAAVVTPEMARQAASFNDQLRVLKERIFAVGLEVARQVLPNLIQLLNLLRDQSTATFAERVRIVTTGLQYMAAAALATWHGISFLATAIGGILLTAFGAVQTTVRATIAVFEGLGRTAVDVGKAFVEATKVLAGFGDVAQRIISRDFAGALQQGKITASQFAGAVEDIMRAGFQGIEETAVEARRVGLLNWEQVKLDATNAYDQLLETAEQYVQRRDAIFNRPSTVLAATPGAAAGSDLTNAPNVATVDATELMLQRQIDAQRQARELERQFTLDALDGINQRRAAVEAEYASRLEQIARMRIEEDESWRLSTLAFQAYEKKKRDVGWQTVSAVADQLGTLAQAARVFGKKGYAVYQALASAQAVVSTAAGVARALADWPWPFSLVVGGIVAAAGAAQIAAIASSEPAGVAHGGLDFVPDDSTFLLRRGEAVLQPEANRDLREFLDRQEAPAPIHLTVQNYIGGRPVGETFWQLSRDGVLTIHPRAITEVPA
jgi:hypothetical protein